MCPALGAIRTHARIPPSRLQGECHRPLGDKSILREGFDQGVPVTRRLPMDCSWPTSRCLYSLTRGVVLVGLMSRHPRPEGALVTFATVTTFVHAVRQSTPHARAMRARWSRTTRWVLKMLKVFFVLSISIRPIVAILAHPRVRGAVTSSRRFSADYFKLAKGQCHQSWFTHYVRPSIQFISRRYAVRLRLGEAQPVTLPCWTRPF